MLCHKSEIERDGERETETKTERQTQTETETETERGRAIETSKKLEPRTRWLVHSCSWYIVVVSISKAN